MNEFWSLVKYLKQEVPTKRFQVVVRRCYMKDHGGTSISDNGKITVCIRRTDPIATQIDTLRHEWGHVYELDLLGLHGKYWGIGHSKAYEAWERWQRG